MAMPQDKVEKLLAEVQEVKAIYDPKNNEYKNNAYLHREWKRIAESLNITGE